MQEGASRYNADRREDALQAVGPDGDDSARAATQARHYRTWLFRERNVLASDAGFPVPYPLMALERAADNGERFYLEYFFEQEERNRNVPCDAPRIIKAGGCPCSNCVALPSQTPGKLHIHLSLL